MNVTWLYLNNLLIFRNLDYLYFSIKIFLKMLSMYPIWIHDSFKNNLTLSLSHFLFPLDIRLLRKWSKQINSSLLWFIHSFRQHLQFAYYGYFLKSLLISISLVFFLKFGYPSSKISINLALSLANVATTLWLFLALASIYSIF